MNDKIGDRMKINYEEAFKIRLPMRMPVIIRLDGKCFHTFTKKMNKPFDNNLIKDMADTAKYLCKNIAGSQMAYVQSDEISILIHNYKKLDSEPWFHNEIQKMVSVSASIASSYMSRVYEKQVLFDSRVFVLPESEVNNYFIWRQKDAIRNSISMVAQSLYSHKELQNKSCSQMKEMIANRMDIKWDDINTHKKHGESIIKVDGSWVVDWEMPELTTNHDYVENLLKTEE
jgi:tRNA(His) 5'-end guanylyltransferase